MKRLLLGASLVVAAACAAPVAPAPTPMAILVTPSAPGALPSPSVALASPSAVAPPAASPSPSFLTIKQAGSAYARAVKPYNTAVRRASKLYAGGTSLRAYRNYYAIIAKASDAWIDRIKKLVPSFPPEVQPDIRALIKAEVVYQRRALAASRAKSLSSAVSLAASADRAGEVAVDKAALVRDDLGLKPNA
jgi:hypothetical protein